MDMDMDMAKSKLVNLDVLSTLRENVEAGYTPYNDRPESYIVPILFAFIFIVGILGNGTLVMIFLRHRSMRSIPNIWGRGPHSGTSGGHHPAVTDYRTGYIRSHLRSPSGRVR